MYQLSPEYGDRIKADFATAVKEPKTWMLQARAALAAATVLLQHLRALTPKPPRNGSNVEIIGTFQGCLLLSGIAVENALKSVIAAKGLLYAEGGELKFTFKTKGKSHNLTYFAEQAGLALSHPTEIAQLSTALLWSARYFTPLWSSDYGKKAFKGKVSEHVAAAEEVVSACEGMVLAIKKDEIE